MLKATTTNVSTSNVDNNDYHNEFFVSGENAALRACGNIMSLLDGTNFASMKTISANRCFSKLFFYLRGLRDASNLVLPATTLTNRCYANMFHGSNITSTPHLPAFEHLD